MAKFKEIEEVPKPGSLVQTLKDWGNVVIKEIKRGEIGNVTQLVGVLNLEGSIKQTKMKLTWLADSTELVRLTLVDFCYLITKPKLDRLKSGEKEDSFPWVNPRTRTETLAMGESEMRNLKRGDVMQLERRGYYKCDAPFVQPSKRVVLFPIPVGELNIDDGSIVTPNNKA